MASRASTRTLCASREGASEQGLSSLAAYRAQARSFAQDSTLCSWPWPVRCNSRLFWVAPQLVFGLLQEFARVMQVVIMHQRRRAVRPGAMKTATPVHKLPMQCERGCHRQTAGRMQINTFIRVRSRRTPMQIWAKLRKSLPEQGMPVRITGLALACDNLQYTIACTLS